MKSLKKFSKKVMKDLLDQLIHFHREQDSEVLHEIRVNIKRVKAILNAVGFYKKKFKAHQAFLPFRDIFRKAGAIREPEVLNKILGEKTSLKTNKKEMPTGDPLKIFVEEVPAFIVNILQQWNKVTSSVSKIRKKELKDYLEFLMKEVQKELSLRTKMKNIHHTRKAIKEILYLSKVTNSLSKKGRDFYSTMEELIGQWHDKQILLSSMKKLNGTNKSKLNQLKSASLKDKAKITQLATSYFQL